MKKTFLLIFSFLLFFFSLPGLPLKAMATVSVKEMDETRVRMEQLSGSILYQQKLDKILLQNTIALKGENPFCTFKLMKTFSYEILEHGTGLELRQKNDISPNSSIMLFRPTNKSFKTDKRSPLEGSFIFLDDLGATHKEVLLNFKEGKLNIILFCSAKSKESRKNVEELKIREDWLTHPH